LTPIDLSSTTLRKGSAIATLSAISYGSAVIFVRYAQQAGVSPETVAFLRYAIASLILLLFLGLSGRWTKLSFGRASILFLLGLTAYTIMGLTWVIAFSITPAWLVSLVVALYPLTVTVGSWLFLRERIYTQQVLALGSVLLGGVILFWRPFEGAAWGGIFLMLFNVLISTTYVLVGQRWTRGLPPTVSTVWLIAGAMVGTFLYGLLFNQLSFAFAPAGWIWVTLFATVSTVLAVTMLWWGIGLIGPSRVAILGSFEPLFSILLAVLILGERLFPSQIVGGVFILMGMVLVQWTPRARGGGEG
jgi:drug/metabolite transporter (DMT)-like permease